MSQMKREELKGGYRPATLTLPGNPVQVPYALSKSNTTPPAEPTKKNGFIKSLPTKQFSERVASHDPERVATFLINE